MMPYFPTSQIHNIVLYYHTGKVIYMTWFGMALSLHMLDQQAGRTAPRGLERLARTIRALAQHTMRRGRQPSITLRLYFSTLYNSVHRTSTSSRGKRVSYTHYAGYISSAIMCTGDVRGDRKILYICTYICKWLPPRLLCVGTWITLVQQRQAHTVPARPGTAIGRHCAPPKEGLQQTYVLLSYTFTPQGASTKSAHSFVLLL